MSEPGSTGSEDVLPAVPGRAAATLVGAQLASVLALVGLAVGLVWWWVAPTAQVRIESSGAYFVDPDPETYVVSDLWFSGLSLVAGALAGVLLWRLCRRATTAAVVGLAVGGLVGALLGRWLGQLLGRVDPAEVARLKVGSVIDVSLKLQAGAALLVLPVAALAGWLVRDLVVEYRAARGHRREPDGDGSDVSLAGPAEPAPPTSA